MKTNSHKFLILLVMLGVSRFVLAAENIEVDNMKVRYRIVNHEATAIGVATGNFSLDGLEIADYISYNGEDYPVTSIADNAFKDSSGFKGTLTIGKNIRTIGNNAFQGCYGFTGSLILPDSLVSIGSNTFRTCYGFTGALALPNSVSSVGSYAFAECRNFSSLEELPNSLTKINNGVFELCSRMEGILKLPSSIKSIGENAFHCCIRLIGMLEIPNSVTSIGNYAFCSCGGLSGSLEIPESVVSLGSFAFSGCDGIDGDLIIPTSIKYIDDHTFYGTNFERVICKRLVPPECHPNAFTSAHLNELQVPGEAITAYMMKSPWNKFKTITSIEPLSNIQFAEANVVCPLGGTVKLKVNKTPFGAEGDITFISGNTAVATVDANGVVTGVAKGSTAIIAMSGTLTASCVVTVEDPTIAATALEFEGIIGNVGERVAIGAKVLPANVTDPVVAWTSSNPEVAAVDQEGSVWFNAAGSATVTAECQGYEFSVPFVVKEVAANALNVFPVEAVGGVGHEFSLLALHEPENTTDKSVTWESSDPEVATVSEDGRVSLAAIGSAKITARSGEHTAVCAVTVDETVGLTEMASTGVVIDVVEGGIVVRNVDAGESIAVYSVDGKVVNGAITEGEETKLNLAAGIYIVKVSPATVAKVLVK
ncbi:MAG: leucine-rich repeat protein [Bacteroides sp.]|nr:leucine-rich repeat protein [Bacteroides sp.]